MIPKTKRRIALYAFQTAAACVLFIIAIPVMFAIEIFECMRRIPGRCIDEVRSAARELKECLRVKWSFKTEKELHQEAIERMFSRAKEGA